MDMDSFCKVHHVFFLVSFLQLHFILLSMLNDNTCTTLLIIIRAQRLNLSLVPDVNF